MKREDLLKSKEYWLSKIQIDLFNQVENYLVNNHLNRTQLAEKLGVSKGYISQVLNGDADHRLSKLVELSLAVGVAPQITFTDLNDNVEETVKMSLEYSTSNYKVKSDYVFYPKHSVEYTNICLDSKFDKCRA